MGKMEDARKRNKLLKCRLSSHAVTATILTLHPTISIAQCPRISIIPKISIAQYLRISIISEISNAQCSRISIISKYLLHNALKNENTLKTRLLSLPLSWKIFLVLVKFAHMIVIHTYIQGQEQICR